MAWLWVLPAFTCFPWVTWQIFRVSDQWSGQRVDSTATYRQMRHMGVAVGSFQISIGLALVGLATDQGDYSTVATSTPALILMGLCFIIWGVRGLRDGP